MDQTMPPVVETVLAPIDGSEESASAVEYAVSLADRYDAALHVLYVLGHGVVTGIDAGTVEPTAVADDVQEFLETAASMAEQRGVTVSTSTARGFSPTRKSRHPGSVVLDTADAIDADLIVLPRESVTADHVEVLEKASEYVLSYASQPVLSV